MRARYVGVGLVALAVAFASSTQSGGAVTKKATAVRFDVSSQALRTGSTKFVITDSDGNKTSTVLAAGDSLHLMVASVHGHKVSGAGVTANTFGAQPSDMVAAFAARRTADAAALEQPDAGVHRQVATTTCTADLVTGKKLTHAPAQCMTVTAPGKPKVSKHQNSAMATQGLFDGGAYDFVPASGMRSHCGWLRYTIDDSDPNHFYTMDNHSCTSYGSSSNILTGAQGETDYPDTTNMAISAWNPDHSIPEGTPTTVTIGIAAFGLSSSFTFTVYPSEYYPWFGAPQYRNWYYKWSANGDAREGSTGPSKSIATPGSSIATYRNGTPFTTNFSITDWWV